VCLAIPGDAVARASDAGGKVVSACCFDLARRDVAGGACRRLRAAVPDVLGSASYDSPVPGEGNQICRSFARISMRAVSSRANATRILRRCTCVGTLGRAALLVSTWRLSSPVSMLRISGPVLQPSHASMPRNAGPGEVLGGGTEVTYDEDGRHH